jgi:zinc protease
MRTSPLLATPAVAAWLATLAALPAQAAPAIVEHTCPNGLTVLVAEDHALPLVTVEIAAHNGSMTEPPEFNGLSHLYEHMFFKANQAIPTQEKYLARARELGMVWNGTTSTERVNYFFTTTTDHLDEAMVFLRDAIVSPLFGADELKREREVVVGEIDRNVSTPGYHLGHAVTTHVFWKYPSRKNPLGDAATVRAATPAKMHTIQERYYVPNNSALVVTGDVKAAEIFARADSLYTGWARGADPFVKYPLVTHPPIAHSEVVVVPQPVTTFTGQIVWQGPSTFGPDTDLTYAADLLGVALGEPSSRFQKALVDSGACLHAGLSWSTQRNVGPVTLSVSAQPEKIDACVKAAFAELPRIKESDYVSDAELTSAAHTLDVDLIRERERGSSYAHAITYWWASASLDYYRGYVEHLKKVTRADIARYLDGYVLGKPFVFGAMLSPEMEKKGHDRAHLEALAGLAPTKDAPAKAAPVKAVKKGSK